jgi:hypothetical protein
MPNEFNIKNGFITSGNSNVYANLNVTGGLTATTISATTYFNLPFSGSVIGSGTTGYLPKWTGSTGLSNSLVYDSTTGVTIGTGFTWDNTNNRLGIGTASPADLLTINANAANARIRYNNSNSVQWTAGNISSDNSFRIGSATNFQFAIFQATGNVLLQNGGTFTDAGFKLDVAGTARIQNQFSVTGSISAASAIARGAFLNQTLVATANSDVLVGLDIAPTFTNGAFTGVTNAALRVGGAIIPLGSQPNIGSHANAFGTLVVRNVRSDVDLQLGAGYSATGENGLRMFSSTRNVVIQNGGTFTDAGFRLDVFGNSRISGNLTVTGNTSLQSLTATTISATTYQNLPSFTFTGGTVSGATNFTGGLSANTFSATTATIRKITGGSGNTNSGTYSFIGGGQSNIASNDYSTVGGGKCNTSSGLYSFIGAGGFNVSSGGTSSIISGNFNTNGGDASLIGSGCQNIINSVTAGFIGGGSFNTVSNNYSVVGGGASNTASGYISFVGGGSINTASSDYSTVGGGRLNTASGYKSTISGGYKNTAGGACSFIGGGQCNTAPTGKGLIYQSIGGGLCNTASGGFTTIGGGNTNTASGGFTTIGGGNTNTASGNTSTISGGYKNTSSGNYSTVSGGYTNTASGPYSNVGGGRNNTSSGNYSSVGGGNTNIACNPFSNISGGYLNTSSGYYSFVGGGRCNSAESDSSTVSGGYQNTVSGKFSTIGGGTGNIAKGTYATSVFGGAKNSVEGDYSFIGGGLGNTVSGKYSGVLGGCGNTVSGDYSFAAGCGITASVNNTFYANNFCSSSGTITATGTKGSIITSGSSTTAFLTFSGSNTVGGTGYTDFIRVVNTAAGATNATKTIRVNITGGIEFLNSAYLAQTLALTDGGILYVGGGNTAATSNNDPTTNYLSFNNNGTSIYDDGNTHIHSRSNGGSMWINTNNGAIILGNQSPVLGGGAASGIIMGSGSTTVRAFANIYGGKTYTIGSYGFLATIGAGTGAGTTATYGLYVQQRVEATEFDATSDERLKNIQGEIELDDAIKLVNNLKPIKFTWKDKDNEGIKAGYSAQQVVKSGFNHLIGHIKNEDLIETTDDEGFTSPEGFQLTMNYDQVTPYHGVVIKHLLNEIDNLKKEIEILKSK